MKREFPEFLGNEIDELGAYTTMLSYLKDTILTEDKYLNDAKGRSWYRPSDKYRIGIMPYDRAKKANQFVCFYSYFASFAFFAD